MQIIKACLLLGGAPFMAFMVMAQFGFSPRRCSPRRADQTDLAAAGGKTPEEAAKLGQSIMGPGKLREGSDLAISFGMALMFGTAGLPHILMRFFTVPPPRKRARA